MGAEPEIQIASPEEQQMLYLRFGEKGSCLELLEFLAMRLQ